MTMHPITHAAVIAALRAELQSDPTARGYAGKAAAELLDLLNAPIVTAAAQAYRDVPVSSVEGYMRLRRHIVRLRRWVAEAPVSDLRDFAEEMLDMMAAANVQVFETSVPAKRTAILGAFAGLAEIGAGGFNAQSLADLTAMTLAPAGPDAVTACRWAVLMDGLSAEEGYAGPPNACALDLIEEALVNGNG